MKLPDVVIEEARSLLEDCKRAQLRLSTAESCTGGWLCAALTDIAGSSAVIDRGFVTYSNEAKTELLGVSAELILAQGAVSEAVAKAMAEGALLRSRAHLAIAITGIAGPGGGSTAKPVGQVHFALAQVGHPPRHSLRQLPGDRREVRIAAVAHALWLLREAVHSWRP